MMAVLFFVKLASCLTICAASYHEQYRVPQAQTDKWESYIYDDKEYIIQNLPVNWENAKILCRGHHNGTLAILDSKDKADFMAEALSESQLSIESIWVGARRGSAEDPAGYRWSQGVELRRTAADVLVERDGDVIKHYPVWLNRTLVPVPEAGADCVGLERVFHDKPVFVDLPCYLERAFVCEREARIETRAVERKIVRCRNGLYRLYDGLMNWHQAAAYCLLNRMSLANIGSMKCLKKLGMSMLKVRPSIENAWIGARGALGRWSWLDSGLSVFQPPPLLDVAAAMWPPLRDRNDLKQSGCMQLDRHAGRAPVFLEARCERRMHFICYQEKYFSADVPNKNGRKDFSAGATGLRTTEPTPSDDVYYYVLVKQKFYWQHAYENCQKLNGTLAFIESHDALISLLLLMGENKDEPIGHIWISGRLNMTKDATDTVSYTWYNPSNGKRIYDSVHAADAATLGLYVPPWLDDDFSLDNSCLNLDRQDHLNAIVYGLPCDTPQYSICMIEKAKGPTTVAPPTTTEETAA
ncbi:uncharacterized protein LOC128681491 isoform X2 [Plodia interpunctella]|uniref:uncharacterized protein LOC128681491 isoform X2 n=1 Tax=Plodia interpunctella TaxID=58824 RepID=UPI0023678412|nr:uncharacterized protein LOC128681491 isoform X2 [Plodia interpunctella]